MKTLSAALFGLGLFLVSCDYLPFLGGPTPAPGPQAASLSDYPVTDVVTGFTFFDADGNSIGTMDQEVDTAAGVLLISAEVDDVDLTYALWVNGEVLPLIVTSGTSLCEAVVILSPGRNEVAVLVMENGVPVARSLPSYLVSSVPASVWRFQLSWSGADTGDLDIHADDGSNGYHISYADPTIDVDGWSGQLDMDSQDGALGPENLRVYTLPEGAQVRVWVNCYYAAADQEATVAVYHNDVLYHTYHHTFSTGDILTDDTMTDGVSWLIGSF